MMAALFAHLRAHGFGSAGLWCFARNPPARRLYEALGGIAGIEQAWELDRQRVTEIAYRFEPIPRL